MSISEAIKAGESVAESLALRVVALEQVTPHENFHGRRVAELAARLEADGRLVNPPIATPVGGEMGERYVVLDGATRLTAFRHLGYPHIVLQVVEIERQRVQLGAWRHVVHGGGGGTLAGLLARVDGLRMTPCAMETVHERVAEEDAFVRGALGGVVDGEGRSFLLEASAHKWLDALNRMVETYGEWGNVERTLATHIDAVTAQYPDFAGLVIFPRLAAAEVLRLAAAGRTLPAGITRFVIPGRILRLNAPLEMLASAEPLAVKRAWLDELVRERLAYRQVRYYEEPVLLLDE